jgi:hypothetical protein
MTFVEPRYRSGVEEMQPMKFGQRIHTIAFMTINLANSVHKRHLHRTTRCQPSALSDAGRRSSAERRLDAKPDRSGKASHDRSDDGLENIALRLLDASPPTAQVLKVSPETSTILLLHAEGSQSGHDGLHNYSIDILMTKLLLLG